MLSILTCFLIAPPSRKRRLVQARAVGRMLFLSEDRSRESKTGRYTALAAIRLREERIDLEGGLEPGHGIWYRVSARKAIGKYEE